MKNKIILQLTILLFIFSGCSKNDEIVIEKPKEKITVYEATGTITGPDLGMCVCCGGWKLIIDNVVLPTNLQHDPFRFQSLPTNSNIDLANAIFPLKIKFNWSNNPNSCGSNYYQIIIDDIILN